ncbi:CBS domain-containing protein [Natronogracilivirga saccharolytica]|uniref:CBS domain-containing protein n=1 Tax=Natronogracilivirga saccharolytica TaxID=2812953 RepID=A0A8J7RTS5_9BACT|nr:CBS domain-containing protein [Natronogracilivirga saccharolytica]MBP3193754.1 CBS domain-containing protein [Natronogracilivirga saccharolytica]
MKIKDILNKKGSDVISVPDDSMVYDAIALMADKNIGALVVMCQGSMCGIVSERDYRNKIILKGRHSKDTPVRDIMTRQVMCVTEDYELHECMRIMSEKKIRHLPVIDDKRNVTGMISIGDIVKAIIDEQKSEINDLRNYITSGYPG